MVNENLVAKNINTATATTKEAAATSNGIKQDPAGNSMPIATPTKEIKPVSILNKKPQPQSSTNDAISPQINHNITSTTIIENKTKIKEVRIDTTPTELPASTIRVVSPTVTVLGEVSNNMDRRTVSNTSTATAVSFSTSTETEKTQHHRYSISNKPASKSSSVTTSPNQSHENLNSSLPKTKASPDGSGSGESSTTLEEKNSIVHMPGDFIYFDTKDEPVAAVPKTTTTNPKEVVGTPTGPRIPFYEFFQREDDKKFHILIGATGSVATIKVPLIIDKLFKIYTCLLYT